MKSNIIGRKNEQCQLELLYQSRQAEFVVIYGRRRVGKTFLVREFFEEKFAFYHTALSPFEMMEAEGERLIRQQLMAFGQSLRLFGDYHDTPPKDWFQAFEWLRNLLQGKSKRKRWVVFIDELPWLDTPRSGFLTAFEYFWNGWGAGARHLMLVVCGSAASWISDKLLNNTGGLYGRTTREMHLSPFSLAECKEFFKGKGIVMDHYDILQAYMILGGIPYYMSYFEKGKSLAQNIDQLFFSKGGKLQTEYDRLFTSLFVDSDKYKQVVRALSKRREGLTRKELIENLALSSGGGLTSILNTLIASDFIMKYIPFGGSSHDTRYKLVDLFSLFYMFFIDEKNSINPTFWQNNLHSSSLDSWRGISFEEVCFVHLQCIKHALGISGVHCEVMPWRSKKADDHTQIDMVIDRDDRVVNICEMKFSSDLFTIDKSYDGELRRKIQSFVSETGVRKNPYLTIITTYGLKQNAYSGKVQNVVTAEDLFRF